MEPKEFDALIARLSAEARERPTLYRLRVGFFALLGYAYILFFLATLLACLLVVYFWSFALPLLYFLVRALWVRIESPEGLPVESYEAPRLFNFLRKTSAAFHRPSFHSVLVTDQMNAGVTQIPRLGIFGWDRNYLCLGMPLLLALTPEELEALLAHEHAHLFGAHSRFSIWIIRVRRTWDRLMMSLEMRKPRGAFLFRTFFEWYAPLFSAHAFALDRSNEIEADQFAADWIGPSPAAQGLIKLSVYDMYWRDTLWPRLRRQADNSPEPSVSIFGEMQTEFRGNLPAEKANEYLRIAMQQVTANDDPHPSLADRLKQLGVEPRVPTAPGQSAAAHFLGASLPGFIQMLDERWRTRAADGWKARFATCEEHRKRLAGLEEAQRQGLTAEQAWEIAYRSEDLYGSETSLPLYQAVLQQDPNFPAAHYAVGRLLLARGDEKGINHLERAVKLDSRVAVGAYGMIRDFLYSAHKREQAEGYQKRLLQAWEVAQRIQQERAIARPGDRYGQHDLSRDEIEALAAQLRNYAQIARAYFVRKYLPQEDRSPFYLLCVEWRLLWPMTNSQKIIGRIAKEVKVPRDQWAVVSIYGNRQLGRAIKAQDQARIYHRGIIPHFLLFSRRPRKSIA